MQAACRTCGFWLQIYLDRMELRTQGTTSLFFRSKYDQWEKRNEVKITTTYLNICDLWSGDCVATVLRTETPQRRTVWRAVLVLGAGPRIPGSSRSGAYRSTADGLTNCELKLHLFGLESQKKRKKTGTFDYRDIKK